MPGSSTVFVVDDDISVRESLDALLRVEGWKVRAFASAHEFLADHATDEPCCLILDVGLPDLNGLELQALLAEERDHMPVIFITGCGDIPTSVRAMKAGASEFLTKPFAEEVLLDAIRAAHQRSEMAREHRTQLAELVARYGTLTNREREVMARVVSGRLNKQIGGDLGISEVTVKVHRGRVMQKMNARSLAALVNMSAMLEQAIASGPPSGSRWH